MGISAKTSSLYMQGLARAQKASDYMQTPDALGAFRARGQSKFDGHIVLPCFAGN